MPCVPAGDWASSQRHKQYQGGHDETWNGVTLNVDGDCSDGPVYPAGDQLGSSPCTAPAASQVLDAALVTQRSGWVLTPRSLLLSADGGLLREIASLWSQIACPTLLIFGEESWAKNPADDGRAGYFQDARVLGVGGAGHWVHHDKLDIFLREVRAFLA